MAGAVADFDAVSFAVAVTSIVFGFANVVRGMLEVSPGSAGLDLH